MSPRPTSQSKILSPRPNTAGNIKNFALTKELENLAAETKMVGKKLVTYPFVCWLLNKLGLTMDRAVAIVLFSTVWEVTVGTWKIQYGERTLKLRNLKGSGAEIENLDVLSNPFAIEENKFVLNIADHIDYAVMKYLEDEVPVLVEQEYKHAKMHHSQQASVAEDEENQKWLEKMEPNLNVMRKMILRRGDRLGRVWCGQWEAGNIYGIMFQAMTGFNIGNVVKFHLFEELEHAAVTVGVLKKKTTAIERMIAFPAFFAMWLPQIPMAILGEFYKQPSLLLKLDTYPMTLLHIWKLLLGLAGTALSIFVHWVLPFPVPKTLHDISHAHLERWCKEAGIEWEVEKEVTYPMYL